jgi:hypothetical protein
MGGDMDGIGSMVLLGGVWLPDRLELFCLHPVQAHKFRHELGDFDESVSATAPSPSQIHREAGCSVMYGETPE